MTTLIPKYYQGGTSAVNRPFNEKLQEIVKAKVAASEKNVKVEIK